MRWRRWKRFYPFLEVCIVDHFVYCCPLWCHTRTREPLGLKWTWTSSHLVSFFFSTEWSRSGRASKEGGGFTKGPLGEPDRVCPHQRRLRRGPGQCLEVPVPLLQKWRRYVFPLWTTAQCGEQLCLASEIEMNECRKGGLWRYKSEETVKDWYRDPAAKQQPDNKFCLNLPDRQFTQHWYFTPVFPIKNKITVSSVISWELCCFVGCYFYFFNSKKYLNHKAAYSRRKCRKLKFSLHAFFFRSGERQNIVA